MDFLDRLGRSFFRFFQDMGMFAALFLIAFTSSPTASRFQRRTFYSNFFKQIYFTGVQAFGLITIISLVMGAIIIIQTMNQLPQVGGESLLGTILVVVNFREVGPMIVAFILIGRSATAITTEIGGMRVSGQFDMLLATGVNPTIYLFAPRIWGMVVSLFALNVFFINFSLIGGFIMARIITYIDFRFLVQGFVQSITLIDIVILVLKSFFLAMAISIISIREGLKVNISSTEIPQAASRTVMKTIAMTLIIDVFFAAIFYL